MSMTTGIRTASVVNRLPQLDARRGDLKWMIQDKLVVHKQYIIRHRGFAGDL